jgi:DNA polymerase II small subunit/DNA polymerase delta subunit B
MSEYAPESMNYQREKQVEDKGNDLIIHVTDVHTGIKIDNFFNKFNANVLQYRFNNYLDEIFKIRDRHGSQNAYVIIGEVISGLIHDNLRCENNQNLIEQFMTVSNYLTEFLSALSKEFNEVHVYVTPGNHSRISPKKEQNLKGENFDHLLIPLLSARLQNNKVVHFHENHIEESIAMFGVRGNTVMSSHGDKDSVATVVQKFSLLFQTIPNLVYLGHRHSNGMTTVYNTKVIESGSMSGADSYSLDLRLCTSPEQTVSVVDENGLVCLYDIQLDC